MNASDWLARSGVAPLYGQPPFTLGRDVSGVVAAVGAGVSRFRPGDEVFGMIGGGGCAVHVTAPAAHFAVKPAGLDHVHAAAAPTAAPHRLAGPDRHRANRSGHKGANLRGRGRRGACGGPTRQGGGAYVIGTASADDHDFLRDLGTDELVDNTADLAATVHSVDTALDLVDGDFGPRTLGTLRPGGLLLAAVPGDPGLAPEEAEACGMRCAVITPEPSGERLTKIAALLANTRIRFHVEAALPFTDAARAHELGDAGHRKGSLVLALPN